jgi:prefoldin subunit 5
MSAKLQEIRRRIAKLEEEAKELRRLKSDCNDAKKFRRMLVKEKAD